MIKRELVQVSKISDGATSWAWQLIGSGDPDPADVVWTPTQVNPDAGVYEAVMMNASLVGTKPGLGRGRWGVCSVCLQEFPQSQMVRSNGKWYCIPNKCSEDLE